MNKRVFLFLLLMITTVSVYSYDYKERDLLGLGWTYTFAHSEDPGMFGLSLLYAPMDFFTGFSALVQSDFKTTAEFGLGLERYLILIPSSVINQRLFHLSVGALGTYTINQGFGYDVYLTSGVSFPPLHGLAVTLLYNHIESFALRLEYSGGVFLEKNR